MLDASVQSMISDSFDIEVINYCDCLVLVMSILIAKRFLIRTIFDREDYAHKKSFSTMATPTLRNDCRQKMEIPEE